MARNLSYLVVFIENEPNHTTTPISTMHILINRNSSLTILILAISVISLGACKSKKKVAALAASQEVVEEQVTVEEIDAEAARREAEEKARKTAPPAPLTQRVSNYFQAIATAPSVASANSSIAEALTLFESKNTPVLIVVYDDGTDVDYDEPTTIEKYLNYLKDQKKKPDTFRDMKTNGAGKITELELKKTK